MLNSPIVKNIKNAPWMTKASLLWILLILFLACFGTHLTPYNYEIDLDLLARLTPPIPFEGSLWSHALGTDDLGRDVFSQLMISIKVTLFIAVLGTVIGSILGVSLGFLAAHYNKKLFGIIDHVISMAIDFQASLPFIILALGLLGIWGNSMTLIIVLMGIYGWEGYARLARNLAISSKSQGYTRAIETLGASPFRIYFRHILPNISSVLIVNMTLNFPKTILIESSLSFLGVGVQPPLSSLGTMLSFSREYLTSAWWIALAPAIVIFLSTLSMSIIGDWIRDLLDPHH